jgi:hypothetical protein
MKQLFEPVELAALIVLVLSSVEWGVMIGLALGGHWPP